MKNLLHMTLGFLAIFMVNNARAQNWQYVGAPYINGTTSMSTFLYFGDMEITSTGDIFVSYWDYAGNFYLSQYTAGAWTQLPAPANSPANYLDIEIAGGNYYMAYSRPQSGNMYVRVKKYDGTNWTQLGDSLLLGNTGSGGWFDLVLDNNEVPTIMGVVSGPFADKQIMQYTSGAWSNVVTLAATAPTIFRENSGIFDSQNRLLCVSQGNNSALQTYTLVNMIDGGVRTTVGDTLWGQSAGSRIKIDASGTPVLVYTAPITVDVMAYKLNGSTWDYISDTVGTTGTMLASDITDDGKVVFNTLQTDLDRSVYLIDNSVRSNMDSLNIDGFAVAGVQDLVIPAGSNEVYVLVLETKATVVQDFSVMKHIITPSSAVGDVDDVQISLYPNPASGNFTLATKGNLKNASVSIYDINGRLVYADRLIHSRQTINLSHCVPGCYAVRISDGKNTYLRKLVIQ